MPVEVKICGLSAPQAMDAALGAGADYVGLVFYPPSPRNIDIESAGFLADRARGRAKIVSLVVDAEDDLLARIVSRVRPDYFQAHGREDPARVAAIARSTGVPVIKAIKVDGPADIERSKLYVEAAAMVLFDARSRVSPGGNGIAFDWQVLSRAKAPRRFMLAGGLAPGNVAEAIRITGAPAVDVSSGVESARGVKDPGLIRKFIEAARAAG